MDTSSANSPANSPAEGDDKPAKSERPGGLVEQLTFKSRFVLVFGEIDDKLARATCERLIALSQESDAPIHMLISSPGGHVESGDAIHVLNAPSPGATSSLAIGEHIAGLAIENFGAAD